ncbi:restriction endonuclease subunit S [Microbulbifer sp. SSSA005]|uniref:restriction endonuclease subunit S n=1 Tax=Microbulbifer sp. SSSA005 TaxID=3243378 RepID=UPI00403A340F
MMSDHWTTIGEVAQVFDGPHATPKKIEKGPYFLSISSLENGSLDLSKSAHLSEHDFAKWTKRVTPEEGDVLFSYETRLGNAALMPGGIVACLGRRMGLLRPNRSKVIPEYLLYAYLSPAFQETIRANTIHGATVDRIALKEMPRFPIRIPPIGEQAKVVSILKSLDEKIEINRQTNQALEQIAQTLFKSWFIDFEPTRAKIAANQAAQLRQQGQSDSEILSKIQQEPRWTSAQAAIISQGNPEQAAIAALNGGQAYDTLSEAQQAQLKTTAALFPDTLVDSELGQIPEGWEVKTLDKVTSTIIDHRGKTPKKLGGDWVEEGYPAVSAKNIKGGRITRHETIRFINNELYAKWMKVEIEKGDILLTSEAPMGEMYFIADDTKYCLSQRLYALRANKINMTPSFLYLWLQTSIAQADLEGRATGTTVVGIRQTELRKVNTLVPPFELLSTFESNMISVFERRNINELESQNLTSLLDSLLPKLLNGLF